MDEKRQFFRIKNTGEILATCDDNSLEVIELSSKGVAIIKEDNKVPQKGFLELHIVDDTLTVKFEVLKVENNTMVLIFTRPEDISQLFLLLKEFKESHKKN